MVESLFKIVLTACFTVVWLIALHWTWTSHIDPTATLTRWLHKMIAPSDWVVTRDANKFYQNSKAVSDVTGRSSGTRLRYVSVNWRTRRRSI